MMGWILNVEDSLVLSHFDGPMKFNTALIFSLSGIFMMLHKSTQKFWKGTAFVTSLVIIVISISSGYNSLFDRNVLNLLVLFDHTNAITLSNSGMSFPMACCTLLLGIGLLMMPRPQFRVKLTGIIILRTLFLTANVAILTFILLMPLHEKSAFPFINGIPLESAILFWLITIFVVLNDEKAVIRKILFGKYSGSRYVRRILPVLVIVPLILGLTVITGLQRELIDLNLAITGFTVVSIPLITMYVLYHGIQIDRVDINKKKLQENLEQLNTELTQYKIGLDRVAAISKTDRQGVITYVNEQFCELSQFSRQELVGNTYALVRSGHHKPIFYQNLWTTILGGEVWYGHIKNKTKAGDYFWVESLIIPFADVDGNIYEYLSLQNEITERKEQELRVKSEYVRSLEFKNKELEELTYIASHDLQEPLINLISLTTELVETMEGNLDEEVKKTIGYIQDTSARMSQQIKGILDYNIQFQNIEIQEVNCTKLVEEILHDFSKQIANQKASIVYENLPVINGYELPLRMLFINLISNALKFHSKDRDPKIRIKASIEGLNWIFSVQDNGIGIADHNREKVFKIFQRLQKTSEYQGAGIGLAHCKKIVDLHSGHIWVESEKGKGSTFFFSIPTFIKNLKTEDFYNPKYGS